MQSKLILVAALVASVSACAIKIGPRCENMAWAGYGAPVTLSELAMLEIEAPACAAYLKQTGQILSEPVD